MGVRVFPVTGHGMDSHHGALLGMSLLMGARGLGALIGPVVAAPWAQQNLQRLRPGIMAGVFLFGARYRRVKLLQNATVAYIGVTLAHPRRALVGGRLPHLRQLL